ncbi:MAG: alkaline phosphatase [Phaeodactylibacter sp.]|uniref:alkaline phosphatase n=1 Tax=Phaeodactylibacter sp. TaxID=1940289 RepID=UPI0032ED465C
MNLLLRYLVLALLLFPLSCKSPESINLEVLESEPPARNIIFLIGDGMGISQITAGMYSHKKPLNIEDFKVIGLHKPYAANDLITDSAAGATAFATGHKTNKSVLGLDAEGNVVPNIFEQAKAREYALGLLTTSSIVHATPAGFFAHVPLRSQYEDIAEQLADSKVDFFMGGGMRYFNQREKDGKNLINDMEGKGYNIYNAYDEELYSITPDFSRGFGYFTARNDPPKSLQGRKYLPPATRIGTRFLQKRSSRGFIFMVEGAQIDWAGHANEQDYMIAEMLDFDEAVGEALAFAKRNKETLVIVTADHETGGYAIQPGSRRDSLIAGFTCEDHTASLVPVFAYGPRADLFRGIYENTAIYDKMILALGWGELEAETEE